MTQIEHKRMGDIEVGDVLLGPNGEETTVVATYDEHIPDRMYELEMENGEIIRCSGTHLWYTETTSDKKNKRKYKKLAKNWFKAHKEALPYQDEAEAYPIEVLVKKFGTTQEEQEFLHLACLSLGPTYNTPHILVEDLTKVVAEENIYSYCVKDLSEFIEDMRSSVIHKNGYFYFGQVRDTDEVFRITEEINIPTTEEVKR